MAQQQLTKRERRCVAEAVTREWCLDAASACIAASEALLAAARQRRQQAEALAAWKAGLLELERDILKLGAGRLEPPNFPEMAETLIRETTWALEQAAGDDG